MALVTARAGYVRMFAKNHVSLQMVDALRGTAQGASTPAQFLVKDLLKQ
jgi:hypothetical protein